MEAPWVILYSIFLGFEGTGSPFLFIIIIMFLIFNLGFASYGFCKDMPLIFILVEKGKLEIRGDVWCRKLLPFVLLLIGDCLDQERSLCFYGKEAPAHEIKALVLT
jgi:hypothetical protein